MNIVLGALGTLKGGTAVILHWLGEWRQQSKKGGRASWNENSSSSGRKDKALRPWEPMHTSFPLVL